MDTSIPRKIFQTWHTKNLPTLLCENMNALKTMHPDFEYSLFDDDDCRMFILQYFGMVVLEAYDKLIPGAYKADLWRNCVLYIHGGFYIDIKWKLYGDFRLDKLTDKEHFVSDYPVNNIRGVYNGFMVSQPKNYFLLQAINQIVENVSQSFYGLNSLQPTGPQLLGRFIQNQNSNIDLSYLDSKIYNNKKECILFTDDSYRDQQNKNGKNKHYGTLWDEKNIYYHFDSSLSSISFL
jgi:mannosyltransferase OCH1-like enzyme